MEVWVLGETAHTQRDQERERERERERGVEGGREGEGRERRGGGDREREREREMLDNYLQQVGAHRGRCYVYVCLHPATGRHDQELEGAGHERDAGQIRQ